MFQNTDGRKSYNSPSLLTANDNVLLARIKKSRVEEKTEKMKPPPVAKKPEKNNNHDNHINLHDNSNKSSTNQDPRLLRPRLMATFSIRTFASHPRSKCQPTGLQVTERGEFIIVDNKDKLIKIFSKYGQILEEFGGSHLKKPWNILYVKEKEQLIVSDPGDNTIKVFNKKTGEFIKEFTGAKHLQEPYGMCMNQQGAVLVADKGANCIYKHDTDGFIQDSIKPQQDGRSAFDWVQYMTSDSEGRILITDHEDHSLKAFSEKGQLLFTYQKQEGNVMQPRGVAVDRYGNILVADSNHSCIRLLSPEGVFIRELIGKTEGLEMPSALVIDKDDNLVITDCASQEIKVFSYLE